LERREASDVDSTAEFLSRENLADASKDLEEAKLV
jgi:hypothetical protein